VRILGTYPRSGATSRGPKEQEIALVSETVAPSQLKAPTPVPVAKESPSYRLASRAQRAEDTVIEMNGLRIGGNAPFAVIAGPCSVESREQITACARALHDAGCRLLRGGCFTDCRSSPRCFIQPMSTQSRVKLTCCKSARATCKTSRC